MQPEDRDRFARLMSALGRTYRTVPDDELIELYWRVLADVDYATVEANAFRYLRKQRLSVFPTPAELRSDPDDERLAYDAYDYLRHLCREFLFPGFVQAGLTAIERKLQQSHREYLKPMLYYWGTQLANTDDDTWIKREFIKEFQTKKLAENEKQAQALIAADVERRKQLQAAYLKQLEGRDDGRNGNGKSLGDGREAVGQESRGNGAGNA